MSKVFLPIFFISNLCIIRAQTYEYKIITSVESIITSGMGRSRLIASEERRNFADFTSLRTDGKTGKGKRNTSNRSEIRVKNFEETKLLNFFNLGGIRFQNIAANDAVMSSKINAMVEKGWELAFVTSAVESDAGKDDNGGIFITRYIFKKLRR